MNKPQVKGFEDSSSDESDSDVESGTPAPRVAATNASVSKTKSKSNNSNNSNSNSNSNKSKKSTKSNDKNWNKVTIRLNASMTREREMETEERKKRIALYSSRRREHWQILRMKDPRDLDIVEKFSNSLYNDWIEYPLLSALSVRTRIFDKSIKINLKKVAMSLPNTIYDPSNLDAVSVELMNPNCKISVYTTGAINVSGCRSVISGMYGARKVAKMIRDYCGYEIIRLDEGRAFGGIGFARLPFQVDIEKFGIEFDQRTTFDQELQNKFLTFRDPIKFGDKGTCHVFRNGSLKIMGLENVHLFMKWMDDMYKHCSKFKIDTNAANKKKMNSNQDISVYDLIDSQDGLQDENDAFDMQQQGQYEQGQYQQTYNNINNTNNINNNNINNTNNINSNTGGARRQRRNNYSNVRNPESMLNKQYDYNKYNKNDLNSDVYNAHKIKIQNQYRSLYNTPNTTHNNAVAHGIASGFASQMGAHGMAHGMGHGMMASHGMAPHGMAPAPAQQYSYGYNYGQAQQAGQYQQYQQHHQYQQQQQYGQYQQQPQQQQPQQQQQQARNPYSSNPYK